MTGTGKHMQHTYKGFLFFIFLLLITVLYGCNNKNELKKFVKPDFNPYSISKIAILPIENYTPDQHAGEKIRSLLSIDLLSRNMDVIEPGEVIIILREMKIWSVNSITVKDIKKIGTILKVNAVMMGSVGAYKVSKGISSPYPEVSVSLRLLDANTGNIVWSVWDTTGGADFWARHFGTEGATLDETARQLIKEAVDTLF